MKKIMMLFVAMMLVVGFTGQAMAAFEEGDLIRVVYRMSANGTGTEYATDLGAFSATSPLTLTAIYNTNNFDLAKVGASSMADVNVAYFVMSSTANGGNGAAYASGSTTGGAVNLYAFWGSYQPAASNTLDTFKMNAVGNNASVSQSNAYSYWNSMNGGTFYTGTMGNYLASGDAEKNLATIGTNGYVDQVLYYYGDPDNGANGMNVATIRTFADGHTEAVAVANTPIPAAIYLFGSGLMGLVGLRRKTAA